MVCGHGAVSRKRGESAPNHRLRQAASLCQGGRDLRWGKQVASAVTALRRAARQDPRRSVRFGVRVPLSNPRSEALVQRESRRRVQEVTHSVNCDDDALSHVITREFHVNVTVGPILRHLWLVGRRNDRRSFSLVAARFSHLLSVGHAEVDRKRAEVEHRRTSDVLATWPPTGGTSSITPSVVTYAGPTSPAIRQPGRTRRAASSCQTRSQASRGRKHCQAKPPRRRPHPMS